MVPLDLTSPVELADEQLDFVFVYCWTSLLQLEAGAVPEPCRWRASAAQQNANVTTTMYNAASLAGRAMVASGVEQKTVLSVLLL